ncbi:MAG: hypothetical protein KW793_02615 [Candidatus Doudnabacteria bacterium]|nr:hypothetical protein [Candidatus Doudnabacteria bacterium]
MTSLRSFIEQNARQKVLEEFGNEFKIRGLTCSDQPQDRTTRCMQVKASPKLHWCRSVVITIDVFYETEGEHIRHLRSVIVCPARVTLLRTTHHKTNAVTI